MVQIKGQLWKCKQCSKEKLKHHLKEHVTSHLDLSTKFSYNCTHCGNHFTRYMKFYKHLNPCIVMSIKNKMLTQDETFEQSQEKEYKTVSVREYEILLDKHLRRSGEAPHFEWNCSICGHKTKQKEMLIDHIESMHLHEIVFKCDSCGQTQLSYPVYKRHYKTCLKG